MRKLRRENMGKTDLETTLQNLREKLPKLSHNTWTEEKVASNDLHQYSSEKQPHWPERYGAKYWHLPKYTLTIEDYTITVSATRYLDCKNSGHRIDDPYKNFGDTEYPAVDDSYDILAFQETSREYSLQVHAGEKVVEYKEKYTTTTNDWTNASSDPSKFSCDKDDVAFHFRKKEVKESHMNYYTISGNEKENAWLLCLYESIRQPKMMEQAKEERRKRRESAAQEKHKLALQKRKSELVMEGLNKVLDEI